MPAVRILAINEEATEVLYEHDGRSTFDRPEFAELLGRLDAVNG